MALLNVENLSVAVGNFPVVQNLSFSLEDGQTLGIVGESGCGKSLTALAIMGLLEGEQIVITSGTIYFDGHDLLTLSPSQRRSLMGNQMAMIFQEPMTSLNPVYRVGEQIVEVIRQHAKISVKHARARAQELLTLVRIPDPTTNLRSYPHQLSGGMRQRIMIAMALACNPMLLIADEPTTALDVTVQAQILDLLHELQRDTGMAVLLISHDLGVIAQNCESVAVMYRGRIIESASAVSLFHSAHHHYTLGLLALIPDVHTVDADNQRDEQELAAIPGHVPAIDEVINGCAFHPRCAHADQVCQQQLPALQEKNGHAIMCHHPHGRVS